MPRWSSENKGVDIIMLSLQDNLGLIYRQAMLVILRGDGRATDSRDRQQTSKLTYL